MTITSPGALALEVQRIDAALYAVRDLVWSKHDADGPPRAFRDLDQHVAALIARAERAEADNAMLRGEIANRTEMAVAISEALGTPARTWDLDMARALAGLREPLSRMLDIVEREGIDNVYIRDARAALAAAERGTK